VKIVAKFHSINDSEVQQNQSIKMNRRETSSYYPDDSSEEEESLIDLGETEHDM
jgi:hypothetical protein